MSMMARLMSAVALLCLLSFSFATPSQHLLPDRPGLDCHFTACYIERTPVHACKDGFTSFGSEPCKSYRMFRDQCCKKI
ncbi:hypothetical protein QR680_006190 [Steinernema hermaphroditum]|uniref:Uncharacterized protein n=1 Tax=Steinernema hermaphroditum TaxID=289476 RepID=A0AA39LWZ8_9BILA|nr:hypothetical protein QR680_006190 [Steinernema hermaphroditum]